MYGRTYTITIQSRPDEYNYYYIPKLSNLDINNYLSEIHMINENERVIRKTELINKMIEDHNLCENTYKKIIKILFGEFYDIIKSFQKTLPREVNSLIWNYYQYKTRSISDFIINDIKKLANSNFSNAESLNFLINHIGIFSPRFGYNYIYPTTATFITDINKEKNTCTFLKYHLNLIIKSNKIEIKSKKIYKSKNNPYYGRLSLPERNYIVEKLLFKEDWFKYNNLF